MKIVLVGYMASGKTSIGKKLAQLMNLDFIDLDEFIVKKEEKSITEIFKEKGEIYFRKIEHNYLKELMSSSNDYILALGGGTPCYSGNMEIINNLHDVIVIYLRASIKTLSDKLIRKKSKRPLVAELLDEKIPEFVAKHIFERRPFYEQALITTDVDHKSKKEVALEIKSLLN